MSDIERRVGRLEQIITQLSYEFDFSVDEKDCDSHSCMDGQFPDGEPCYRCNGAGRIYKVRRDREMD